LFHDQIIPYNFTDQKDLDLLFYVASKTGDARLANIAITHASTTLKHHIREDWSTVHVVNFDQHSGKVKDKFTNQGYWDDSTWSRGQAWGVLGFAQVYGWTKRKEFLDASKELARYFLSRLPADGVPHWLVYLIIFFNTAAQVLQLLTLNQ
jgi:glucose-6-phosphate isomerase